MALAHHRLGHADEARAWLAKAAAWYDALVREAGAVPVLDDSWWTQAQFEIFYRRAMRLIADPEWTDLNRQGLQALARERLEAFDPATFDLDLAGLTQPDRVQFHLARASILADDARRDEADAELKKAAAMAPADAFVWKQCARTHARMGRPGEAAEDFRAALRASSSIGEWWTPKGLGFLEEIVRRDDVFAELVRRDASWVGYWDARLQDRVLHRRWGEALTDAARTVEAGLDSREHWNRLTTLQAWNGDRRGLRKACERLLARKRDNPTSIRYGTRETAVACLLLPCVVDDLGPVRDLVELGISTPDLSPGDHLSYLVLRALVDLRAGEPGKAAGRLETLLLAGDDSWTQLALALALARSRLGRQEQARLCLRRASE